MQKKFRFRVLVICYLHIAMMHLPSKFCANSSVNQLYDTPPRDSRMVLVSISYASARETL